VGYTPLQLAFYPDQSQMMVRFFVFMILVFLVTNVAGQTLDTLHIAEFEKTEYRFRQVREYLFTTQSDSMAREVYAQGTVVEMLQNTTPLTIRNLGPSHSASFSNRGLAAAHTAVYWKGVNINSPTTGIADLSLIPAGLIESVAISHGGTSAIMGSGPIGGGIHLNHQVPDDDDYRVELSGTVSSIMNLETNLRTSFRLGSWKSRTALVWNHSQNAFPYMHNARKVPERMIRENSGFEQKGFSQELSNQMGRHLVELSLWGVETNRQLPPSLTAADQNEIQHDLNLKAILAAHLNYSRLKIQIQGGFLHDELTYESGHGIYSHIHSSTGLLHADATYQLSSVWQLRFGSNNTLQQAMASGNYQQEEQVLNNALYAGINYFSPNKKLRTNLMLRQDFHSNFHNAFSPAFSVQYQPLSWLGWQSAVSRNYRIPGFNDRFWYPGGNPDLNPENAWHISAGPVISLWKSKQRALSLQLSGYYNTIDNWIQWIPQGAHWGAVSYKSVVTAGLNSELQYNQQFNNLQLNATVSHVYTRAQNRESPFSSEIAGTSLNHIPAHKITSSVSAIWKGVSIYLDAAWTDSRIPAHMQPEMPSFFIANSSIAYRFRLWGVGTELRGRVHNLLNADYQVMPWMPMPLRHYSVTLKLFFHQNKNQKQ